MLILTVLLCLLPFFHHSWSFNLTYVVKKDDTKLHDPSCIAEENERYTAIGWVYPMPNDEQEILNITTKFIPNIKSDYNCKFSRDEYCNKIWHLKNWQVDSSSAKTYEYLSDRRWEDFPTVFTSNRTKEFKENVEIPNVFEIGISIRSASTVELLACEGWNPYSYACYYIVVQKTKIYLQKFTSLPKNITHNSPLDFYEAFTNILSDEEWRNFVFSLSENGVIKLLDVNFNRTVIEYEDKEQLKPLYLLMRSEEPALWKIHQNHFLYTTSLQTSRLGPTLTLSSKDLCISLFVTTCDYCEMTFFLVQNGTRTSLKSIEPATKWMQIKLKQENVLVDKVNLFVETKLTNGASETPGFWAIDDVRICNENEVKITYLKLNESIRDYQSADYISCQVISAPNWRPKSLVYPPIKDFPMIEKTATSTAINLSWTREDPNNQINYFITYKANDLCTEGQQNLKRIKSNGFLASKFSEISLVDLVPYTSYNITISTVLHEKDKEIEFSTLETERPTFEEFPNKVQIKASDSAALISWEKVGCLNTYGHLFYSLEVTNDKLNFSKKIDHQTDNSCEIDGLEPFTKYNLTIYTARNFEMLKNKKKVGYPTVLSFSTLAGVAPTVINLEIYSMDTNSASLRYDLPENTKGVPTDIQVRKCNALSFKKCKSFFGKIETCKVWPHKYCVDLPNLMPGQIYDFKVSIKNDLTSSYGEEIIIRGITQDNVPGPPTNITYKFVDCNELVDYCHLNISWLHPYIQNGTITAFNIQLNNTETEKDSSVVTKDIYEVYKIDNKTYPSQYTYQIKFVPYSTEYDVFIQSSNAIYKSAFVKAHVKTDDLGDHIDQNPKLLEKGDTSVVFQLPHLDRRLKFYKLTIVTQDFAKEVPISRSLLENKKIADHFCHRFGNTWISKTLKVETNTSSQLVIGDNTIDNATLIQNKPLKPNTKYCFTFIVTNQYKNKEHDVIYFEKLQTANTTETVPEAASPSSQYKHLYVLFVLLLLVPVGFLLYRYIIKRRRRKPKTNETPENVYESLPFEECDENFVVNETYDKLLHK